MTIRRREGPQGRRSSAVEHQVLGIYCGQPATRVDEQGAWHTGLFKAAAHGPRRLTWTNLAGDGQADASRHGGPDKAVCVYPVRHYLPWKQELGISISPGGLGENLSVDIDEDEVCLGDVYAWGTALVEVAQPRRPCVKICRRWGRPELIRRMLETGRSGWYLRVLRPGLVSTGAMTLLNRQYPEWTVRRLRCPVRDR